MAGNTAAPTTEFRDLLGRVASSPQFQKAKRLRELLLYLGQRALKDPNRILREQEIGVDVLGRPADYDTSHDTLVRVLISQLRKKPQEYFAAEGRDEPYILEIPKGNYLPVLRPRETESDTVESLEEMPPSTRAWGRAKRAAAGTLVILAAAAVLWPASEAVARPVAWRSTARPTVEAFWTQLFANGRDTYVVLSDVSLIEFEKLMGAPVRLSEYEAHEFRRLGEQNIADPVQRSLAGEFVNRVTTAVSDVQAARDFGVIASECHLPLAIVSARDASSEAVSSMNTVLLGSWRANPWVGLFEDDLNFRTDSYQETPAAMRFVNRTPRAGEQAFYPAEWRRRGYCRVASLPNPRKTGNVLLISGSDVISTEAGARFMTSEELMIQLRKKLGVKPGRPMLRFEVLLQTQVVNSTVPWFEMVAWRGRL